MIEILKTKVWFVENGKIPLKILPTKAYSRGNR